MDSSQSLTQQEMDAAKRAGRIFLISSILIVAAMFVIGFAVGRAKR